LCISPASFSHTHQETPLCSYLTHTDTYHPSFPAIIIHWIFILFIIEYPVIPYPCAPWLTGTGLDARQPGSSISLVAQPDWSSLSSAPIFPTSLSLPPSFFQALLFLFLFRSIDPFFSLL
jgi:hypothetical protein